MGLINSIHRTPLLRPTAFPRSHNLVIACRSAALGHIPDSLFESLRAIYLIDPQNARGEGAIDAFRKKHDMIKVFNIEDLKDEVSFDVVHFHHIYDYAPLASCATVMRRAGVEFFYNIMPLPYNAHITTPHIPGYYKANREDLETVFGLLEDDESRKVFASRIRAIETGNVGYVRVSKYSEYFHPLVQPAEGDVIIDGGVSESVGAQVMFSRVVGESGKIYGFEPDPIGFCKANERLSQKCPHQNYKVVPLGLWKGRDTLHFDLAGQGTHVSAGGNKNSVACEVISIDEFVAANRIPSVQLIKLDVEGAEADAIKGAIRTIMAHRPKLAISLYHKPEDLYFIPRMVHEISPDYRFYIGHHHATMHETVLYAQPR